MDPVVASHGQLFAIQSTLVNKALASLSEDEVWRRPTAQTNSVGWLVGHVAVYRNRLLLALGGDPEPAPWADLFARGAQVADRDTYPATGEIVDALKRINTALKARMDAAAAAELGAASPVRTPAPDASVRGTVAFLCFHEAYHVGQIAFVMKLLGKPGLVG